MLWGQTQVLQLPGGWEPAGAGAPPAYPVPPPRAGTILPAVCPELPNPDMLLLISLVFWVLTRALGGRWVGSFENLFLSTQSVLGPGETGVAVAKSSGNRS